MAAKTPENRVYFAPEGFFRGLTGSETARQKIFGLIRAYRGVRQYVYSGIAIACIPQIAIERAAARDRPGGLRRPLLRGHRALAEDGCA